MRRVSIDKMKFKILLIKKEITQVEVAGISGISRTTINSIASGKTCSLETGQKIADALKIDLKDILQEV